MTAADILKNYNLNKTHCRVLVLEHLMKNRRALSQAEIEKSLRPLCNRSTIYRILNILSEKNIIQLIVIDEVNKYFYDDNPMSDKGLYETVYFQCVKCNQVIPAGQMSKKAFQLSEGFMNLRYNFVIQGICNKCNQEYYN
ncbi:MAG: transcriptional repressor [Bacteroidales bacterium]|nr:transcriptional repressor [Bacteroidales bacterium]MCF8334020.1 transcriptional repressor [Bacteroidales bacterium]